MKKYLSTLAMICVSCALSAQESHPYKSLKETFSAEPMLVTGNYRAPVLDAAAPTAPPKGYKAFYLSTYTRHGARNFSRNVVYDDVRSILEEARKAGKLTDAGVRFADIYGPMYEASVNRNSDLTAIGAQQQRDLAKRCFKDCKDIFKGRKVVEARSSQAPRCILSMAEFCRSLQQQDRKLQITMQASKADMPVMNPNCIENPRYFADLDEKVMETPSAPYWQDYLDMWKTKTQPEVFFDRLFNDRDWLCSKYPDQYNLLKEFYYIMAIQQCCDGQTSLLSFATMDELSAMFECENVRFWGVAGNNPYYHGRNWALTETSLRDILERAERDIRSDSKVAASLRFGHDFRFVSLLTLLRAEGYDGTPQSAAEAIDWARFYNTPMAANMQFVFYRNKEGQVLVRLVVNGADTKLPIPGEDGPFYTWAGFRKYCNERLALADRILEYRPKPIQK